MEANLEFNLINSLILLALAILWVGWILYRWKSLEKTKKWKVYLFWTITCMGLLMLIIEPSIKTRHNVDSAILDFTDESNYQELKVPNIPKDRIFSSLYDVVDYKNTATIDTLYIIGNDLNTSDFTFLKDIHLVFPQKHMARGFTKLSRPNAFVNAPFNITGEAIGLDSVVIKASNGRMWNGLMDSTGKFNVKVKLTSTGLKDLIIKGYSDKDTTTESIPIEVKNNPKWDMLVWSSYPSYEINYQKNFWTQQGYGYVLRQNISKQKVQSSFVNFDKIPIKRINNQLLSAFNFFNVDIASWNGFTPRERTSILDAVKYNGLTCIIRPQEGIIQARDLPYHNFGKQQEVNAVKNEEEIKLIEYNFKGDRFWQPIVYDEIRMAVARKLGIGKVVLNLVGDTYPLVLSGKEKYYSSMWAHYYSNIFQFLEDKTFFAIPFWNWKNQNLKIDILNYINEINEVKINDNISLPLIEVPGIKGIYMSQLWTKEGWNEISTNLDDDNHFFYSFLNNEWTLVKHKQLKNAATIHNASIHKKITEYTSARTISFWWSYLLLLLGLGGLWLQERLD